MKPPMTQAVERLMEDERDAAMLGIIPDRGELFVGLGPEDPDRWTWQLAEYELQQTMDGLVAVDALRRFLRGA